MYIQNFIYGIQCIKHSFPSQSKCSKHLHREEEKKKVTEKETKEILLSLYLQCSLPTTPRPSYIIF